MKTKKYRKISDQQIQTTKQKTGENAKRNKNC